MTVTSKQIRIVKRAARHGPLDVRSEENRTTAHNPDVMAQRAAVTIVTGWVRELRQQKVAEATRGFDSLFGKASADSC
ncbi:MAG: hypothetical protein ACJ74W_06830 [Pyrinomonadaceae bacterium]